MLTIQMQYQTMKCDYSDRKAVMARLRRSFGEGVGSIMSIQGSDVRMPLGSLRTDAELLRSDWERVGRDMRWAMRNVK